MFRVSQHPSSGVLKTVPAASGTGHTTCTATPLQRGLIGTGKCELILLMMGAVTPETCRVALQLINICIVLHLLDLYSHSIIYLDQAITASFQIFLVDHSPHNPTCVV